MSGTQGVGTNVGTFSTTSGFTCNFSAAVQNSDGNPPVVQLTPPGNGTLTVGSLTGTIYPVSIANLSAGTTLVQIVGDNVDDCFLTIDATAPPVESFSVDPTTVTFVA